MSEQPTNEVLRITMIYAGDRINKEGKRIQEWLEVDGLPNEGEPFPDDFSAFDKAQTLVQQTAKARNRWRDL